MIDRKDGWKERRKRKANKINEKMLHTKTSADISNHILHLRLFLKQKREKVKADFKISGIVGIKNYLQQTKSLQLEPAAVPTDAQIDPEIVRNEILKSSRDRTIISAAKNPNSSFYMKLGYAVVNKPRGQSVNNLPGE